MQHVFPPESHQPAILKKQGSAETNEVSVPALNQGHMSQNQHLVSTSRTQTNDNNSTGGAYVGHQLGPAHPHSLVKQPLALDKPS